MRQLAAEFLGTFALVFAGTGAAVTNDLSGGAVTHVGVALTFGLIVLAMVYALGDVSGAHLNPAVTLGVLRLRAFPRVGRAAVFAQPVCGGRWVASLTVKFLFPDHLTLGATLPAGSAAQSFVLEVILTFLLMFVIMNVSTGPKETGILAGIAVGAVVALEALFAGPICGASMNPARSLGPAVASWRFASLWIYLTAPIIGAVLGVGAWRCVRVLPPALVAQGDSA